MKRRHLLVLALGLPLAGAAFAPAAFASAPGTSPAAETSRAHVLVFGGTGRLGAEIARELVRLGHDVTVFARTTSDRGRLAGLPMRVVEGDALRDDDVRRALESRRFDVVVDALGRSESPPGFFEITGRSIARWSKQTGVRQVILHGSVGAGDSREALPGRPTGTMADVLQAKEAAERALVESGVPYTIIRNGILREGGGTAQPRLVEDPRALGPVSRRSLAQLTGECILAARCLGRVFHALDGPARAD